MRTLSSEQRRSFDQKATVLDFDEATNRHQIRSTLLMKSYSASPHMSVRSDPTSRRCAVVVARVAQSHSSKFLCLVGDMCCDSPSNDPSRIDLALKGERWRAAHHAFMSEQ